MHSCIKNYSYMYTFMHACMFSYIHAYRTYKYLKTYIFIEPLYSLLFFCVSLSVCLSVCLSASLPAILAVCLITHNYVVGIAGLVVGHPLDTAKVSPYI